MFEFIEIDKLSERVLSELCELYINSNENNRIYFDYLKHDLKMIKEIIDQKKNFQFQLEKIELLKNQIESEKMQIQIKLDETEQLNKQQKNSYEELKFYQL